MIKWKGTLDGREVIAFGLEEMNLKRLRDGDPIHVMGAEWGFPYDVLIYYGKDMATLMKMTEHKIGPDTIVHDHRERKKQ